VSEIVLNNTKGMRHTSGDVKFGVRLTKFPDCLLSLGLRDHVGNGWGTTFNCFNGGAVPVWRMHEVNSKQSDVLKRAYLGQ
jgi:hypothetical protein